MGICAQCTFFRRVKPASQLLARVIATTDAAVSNALTKIVEDEQKQRDAEAEFKRSQATGDNDKWVTRPVMSDYCGFNLDENGNDLAIVNDAFVCACRFEHEAVASLLLERSIALDPELGEHIDGSTDRVSFIRCFKKSDLAQVAALGPWEGVRHGASQAHSSRPRPAGVCPGVAA